MIYKCNYCDTVALDHEGMGVHMWNVHNQKPNKDNYYYIYADRAEIREILGGEVEIIEENLVNANEGKTEAESKNRKKAESKTENRTPQDSQQEDVVIMTVDEDLRRELGGDRDDERAGDEDEDGHLHDVSAGRVCTVGRLVV